MRRRQEAGAGVVLVVGATGALVSVLAGALVVLGVVRDLHRVRAAADLAALAAAAPVAVGGAPDCGRAVEIVTAMGARLTACQGLEDGSVRVAAAATVRWAASLPGLPTALHARARAGPEPAR